VSDLSYFGVRAFDALCGDRSTWPLDEQGDTISLSITKYQCEIPIHSEVIRQVGIDVRPDRRHMSTHAWSVPGPQ
jgi:hypothetical protein